MTNKIKNMLLIVHLILISFSIGIIFGTINNSQLYDIRLFKWFLPEEENDETNVNELVIKIPSDYDKKQIYMDSASMIIFDVIADKMINRISSFSRNPPDNIKMYTYLKKYAKEYNVPLNIALGIAKHESGYMGVFHWNYNPKVTSIANAHGAMQIRVPTANHYSNSKITEKDLLDNLKLNVELSMKIISSLKERHGTWELALGAYNTGRPKINSYARNIASFDIRKELILDDL